jgi:phenylalanyl-tRNA synthetase beta chain
MKFSTNWLQTFFDEKLPNVEELAEKITYHSSEIEEIITLPGDTVIDVKVLPDKSAWLMSHRGMAKEISTILDLKLKNDWFAKPVEVNNSERIKITLDTQTCDYYAAALIEGVKVGPSPAWLKEALEAIGQRSINNIVDATNYVMFELGQPLHAFDATKLKNVDSNYFIEVRGAADKEQIVTLMGESVELSATDAVITDGHTNMPIGIAGVKGGSLAAVDNDTTSILLESAHFDRVAIRNTAKRTKLQTDASKRYENGIPTAVAPIAFRRVVDLIISVAGGTLVAENKAGSCAIERNEVTCSLAKINSVLGLTLTEADVTNILNRFGYKYEWKGNSVSIVPPFERDDLSIAEDLVEEVGRIYGLDNIVSVKPKVEKLPEFNARHFYAEKIRETLISLGFSEVYTSSFRNVDIVKIENALASDKGYLRSTLVSNLREAIDKNIAHRDLLGLSAIKLFEIGTVFNEDKEEFRVALGVQSGTAYKQKVDEPLQQEAINALRSTLGVELNFIHNDSGIVEFSMDAILSALPTPDKYDVVVKLSNQKYKTFSNYPAISRDIAMWVEKGTVEEITKELMSAAGNLCVRISHLDTFSKDNKTSYAFRLVFQSTEKTLTDTEVQMYMDEVYKSVAKQGWEPR